MNSVTKYYFLGEQSLPKSLFSVNYNENIVKAKNKIPNQARKVSQSLRQQGISFWNDAHQTARKTFIATLIPAIISGAILSGLLFLSLNPLTIIIAIAVACVAITTLGFAIHSKVVANRAELQYDAWYNIPLEPPLPSFTPSSTKKSSSSSNSSSDDPSLSDVAPPIQFAATEHESTQKCKESSEKLGRLLEIYKQSKKEKLEQWYKDIEYFKEEIRQEESKLTKARHILQEKKLTKGDCLDFLELTEEKIKESLLGKLDDDDWNERAKMKAEWDQHYSNKIIENSNQAIDSCKRNLSKVDTFYSLNSVMQEALTKVISGLTDEQKKVVLEPYQAEYGHILPK